MAEEIVEVTLSSNFYRDSYQKLLSALLISATIIVFLVGILVYLLLNPPESKYFAVDTDKRIIPLVPLDMPNLSQAALLQWANTAAISAYTYNFVNYQAALNAAAEYFTPEGWAAFRNALSDSGNLDDVIAKKLVVSAVATGAPVILDQGKLANVYTWSVQIPLLVTYQSASQYSQQTLTINMLITRVSSLDSAKGIGISQFSVSSGGGAA